MKFNPFFNSLFFVILRLLIFTVFICSSAKARSEIEDDIKNITSKLRCMTCQNQTIYSSDADFSLNIKKIVKEKLEKKETEKEIIDFLTYRYGEYILFEPQMNTQNIFLWFFPFLILGISLVFLILRTKKTP